MMFDGGFPNCWWTYAAPRRCFRRNRTTYTNSEGHFVRSAWQMQYDTDDHWGGHAIPFGAGVWYYPSPTKWTHEKWQPRLCFGIFLGYSVLPGDLWSGDYLVASLDDFVGNFLEVTSPIFYCEFPGSSLGSSMEVPWELR